MVECLLCDGRRVCADVSGASALTRAHHPMTYSLAVRICGLDSRGIFASTTPGLQVYHKFKQTQASQGWGGSTKDRFLQTVTFGIVQFATTSELYDVKFAIHGTKLR